MSTLKIGDKVKQKKKNLPYNDTAVRGKIGTVVKNKGSKPYPYRVKFRKDDLLFRRDELVKIKK